jgi:hypothetical protein
MSPVVALVVALLLSPTFVARSGAAALAPKRASDLRTVTASKQHGCPSLFGFAVDTVQNPDGTTAPFVVPPGNVFIITSWEWIACASTPDGHSLAVRLSADNGSLTDPFLSIGTGTASSTSSTNCSGGSVQTPPGVAVKSGTTLCIVDPNATIVVHGFITRDN